MRAIVAQTGAREHFLAARSLYQHGALAGLVTDWYTPRSVFARGLLSVLGKRGAASARAAECVEIPHALIRSMPFRCLLWKRLVRKGASQGRLYDAYAETDAAFARAVACLDLPPHDVFFGYSYASLEMIEAEKARGVFTVVDQIDPGPAEFRLVAEEMRQHPRMAGEPPEFPPAYYDRARREWELVDVIVVNSEWSREAIISEGADSAKIEVLPLAYELAAAPSSICHLPSSSPGTLRVLWLGQVNIRKGIHYLIEAARLLERENVRFQIIGPLAIRAEQVASAPRTMTFHGPVSRDRAAEWYRQSDVFVLPTLSDGFALTQLEALAHGLPVITTPNCGRVVENGKTGFVVPARDLKALADAILRFVRTPSLTAEMAPRCREAAKAYSIDTYGERLAGIIKDRAMDQRRCL